MRWPCLKWKRRPRADTGCCGLLAQALLALLLLGAGDHVGAAEVEGLYKAQVPVADQGPAERARGMSEAFRLVVLQVTGHRDAPTAARRVDASRFVEQFRYVTDQESQAQPSQPAQQASPGLALRVQFDKAAVDGWLRDQGLGVSVASRPGTLLWLGIEHDGQRELFVPDLDPETTRLIRSKAAARGLTIVFPLADLEDRGRLSAATLWADAPDSLRAASQRYRPDVVLSGRLSRAGVGGWSAQWTLLQGDRVERWHDQQADLAAAIGGGLGKTADALGAVGSVPRSVPGTPGVLQLRVSNVLSLADYERVRQHLESLPSVRSVELLALEPDAVRLSLTAGSEEAVLVQSLEIGRLLAPVFGGVAAPPDARPAALGVSAPVLEYRLSP